MALYQQSERNILICWIVLSILFLGVGRLGSGSLAISNFLEKILYPARYTVNLPQQEIQFWHAYRHYAEEIEALKAQNMRQSLLLQRMNTVLEDNQSLRLLLNASRELPFESKLADVLFPNIGAPFSQRMLLKSTEKRAPFRIGSGVLESHGVVGVVYQNQAKGDEVLLLTDPRHELPIRIQRTGLKAIAVGEGRPDILSLKHLPLNADIKIGDFIETSGVGGRFSAGFSVGQVCEIHPGRGGFLEVKIRPSVSLENIHQVLVLDDHHHVL